MNYKYLLRKKQLFPAAIGMSYERFEQLLKKFRVELRRAEREVAWSKPRLRLPGAGRKATLKTDRQKLFFILFYYKNYPTFSLLEIIFCFDLSNTFRWVKFLEKVLEKTVSYKLELPKVKARYLGEVIEVCPQLKDCLIDASERKVNRPKYNQEFYYSGKKKCHTVKNQIYLDPKSRKILSISKTVEGKRHDKQLATNDSTLYAVPPNSTILADSGYLGLEKENKRIKLVTPYKKPPKKELSDLQKQTNRQISSIRVRVEHPFAWMKHFHILKHQFRGRVKQADLPFRTIAALYNFNLDYK